MNTLCFRIKKGEMLLIAHIFSTLEPHESYRWIHRYRIELDNRKGEQNNKEELQGRTKYVL